MNKNAKGFIPYMLPVLGGLIAIFYVNFREMSFLNPMLAVAVGVFLGWGAAQLLRRFMR
ncbi:hypothetical protein [Ruegeria sp. HKCCD8929]|uniref:hypothetical protein n=1 Tax=Ruegeria sp. HKCCD8929 TaxID=2683006 RepID=UPI001489C9FB|nr:hypothetical protein [Ruegeria sp. HKCCD8929]